MAHPGPVNEERQSKVRSTIRQCVRDWADEVLIRLVNTIRISYHSYHN
jgi:hypothetical protein